MLLVAVAGMVGSGKTTLCRALASRFGLQLALESVGEDNPWLERYYERGPESQREYALRLQMHFLLSRFEYLRQMRGKGGAWLLDRTWYEDAEVFARGLYERDLMSALDYQLYQRLYGELLHSPAARPPQLLIYLHAPLDVVVERIRTRGRPEEQGTDLAYWALLHERYQRWADTFRRCPVLSIDVRDYDLVHDPDSLEAVAALVRERLEPSLPQTELWPPRAGNRESAGARERADGNRPLRFPIPDSRFPARSGADPAT